LTYAKIQEYKTKKNIQVVKPAWVVESIRAGRRLVESSFAFEALQTSHQLAKEEGVGTMIKQLQHAYSKQQAKDSLHFGRELQPPMVMSSYRDERLTR